MSADVKVLYGREVRLARESAGLSLSRCAENLGIAKSYLWKIERGEVGFSPETAVKLFCALGVLLDDCIREASGIGS